jgi:hypothetical protein
MVQRSNDAALQGAQIKFKREECVKDMEQRLNRKDAAVKDALILSSREEYVLSMVQRSNDAALQGAQIKFKREECVKDMEQK